MSVLLLASKPCGTIFSKTNQVQAIEATEEKNSDRGHCIEAAELFQWVPLAEMSVKVLEGGPQSCQSWEEGSGRGGRESRHFPAPVLLTKVTEGRGT